MALPSIISGVQTSILIQKSTALSYFRRIYLHRLVWPNPTPALCAEAPSGASAVCGTWVNFLSPPSYHMGTLSFDIPPNCRWIIHNGHLLLSFFVPTHTVRPAGSIPAFRSKLPPHYTAPSPLVTPLLKRRGKNITTQQTPQQHNEQPK